MVKPGLHQSLLFEVICLNRGAVKVIMQGTRQSLGVREGVAVRGPGVEGYPPA